MFRVRLLGALVVLVVLVDGILFAAPASSASADDASDGQIVSITADVTEAPYKNAQFGATPNSTRSGCKEITGTIKAYNVWAM